MMIPGAFVLACAAIVIQCDPARAEGCPGRGIVDCRGNSGLSAFEKKQYGWSLIQPVCKKNHYLREELAPAVKN